MYLPPLQPVSNFDIYVSGDVSIHPSAIIAPGVILQAAPGGRIIIDAQVCLGMGVIINAYEGLIEVQNGATIGSGVLIIGTSTIGNNACIGTATTIFNASIPPMAAIAPGSIIGDKSRQVNIELHQKSKEDPSFHGGVSSTTSSNNGSSSHKASTQKEGKTNNSNHHISEPVKDEWFATEAESKTSDYSPSEGEVFNKNVEPDIDTDTIKKESSPEFEIDNKSLEKDLPKSPVVGQVYINQLLLTLFPHTKGINYSSPKDEQ